MRIHPDTDALLIIDVQPTFMPGGELPVPDGHQVVGVINSLMPRFRHVYASQDWHPVGHVSFASSHPGHAPFSEIQIGGLSQTLWPDHGIAGTANAALHPDLVCPRDIQIIHKGTHPLVDSYSAFCENDRVTKTGLEDRMGSITRVFLTGLALDFCVAWSAIDAHTAGYEVFVIEDACRGIGMPLADGGTTLTASRTALLALGVRFIQAADLDT